MNTDMLADLIEGSLAKPTVSFPARGLRYYMESIFSAGTPPVLYHACEWVSNDIFRTRFEQGNLAVNERLKLIANVFLTKEWGTLELSELDIDSKTCKVRVQSCFECEQPVSAIKDCYMTRGLLTGAISVAFNQKLITLELQCRFKGANFCEFATHLLS